MSTATENLCDRCHDPAPVLPGPGGIEIPTRYCVDCADVLARDERMGDEIRFTGRALDRAGMTDRFAAYSLESHPNQDAVAEIADWLDQWWENGNLWLSGPVGTGKSGLAWGIVRRIELDTVAAWLAEPEHERLGDAPPAKALFLRWADLLADLKASFDVERRGEIADPSALLKRATEIHLLVLDDLGRERPTAYALEKLGDLVDARYHRLGITVVTSNYGTRELIERLGSETSLLDGDRIVSRLLEGARGYSFSGRSLRRASR